ncbi:hypothetical protein [Mesorhizobium sp. B2-4-17]|uniref:hypothetical protein n=1 Tax=Mesorhizobium sp. B2-4-17 TaxID=2589932 RepID=UPI001FEEA609|nr:hypothetical protein [Mesorhizobium sp. B2-4-17]
MKSMLRRLGAGPTAADLKVLADQGYDNLGKFLDKTLFQQAVAPRLKKRMVDEFEKIKAGC